MNRSRSRRTTALMAALWSMASFAAAVSGLAQDAEGISASARQQIAEIIAMKDSFSPAEQKLSSNLAFASRQARGLPAGPVAVELRSLTAGMVEVEIKGTVSDRLLARIAANAGRVKMQLAKYNFIRATVPLNSLHLLAEDPDVISIREPALRKTNIGALTSQGYISHRARAVVAGGINGSGVKVGVLSDSASSSRITSLIASGDLGTNTTVLPGQDGSPDTDEGTAMMEVVQDIAPGAQLYFATANPSQGQFAANINQLAQAGCSIIVDDILYFDEGVFQDGIVAQAINTFVAGGGLHVSAAGNHGNFRTGTSSTYEGDFFNLGAVSPPISTSGIICGFQVIPGFHLAYDTLTANCTYINLQWSDPMGASANDYDLFVLNGTGTAVVAFSTQLQNGSSDPVEDCVSIANNQLTTFPAGSRVVIVLHSGNARAVSLRSFSASLDHTSLSIATSGTTSGHPAAQNSLAVVASYWDSARTGTKPFNGTNNPMEPATSDGPRRMFFNPDGTPITPGNLLFATGGGTNFLKPDLTAADGVACMTPGFQPFFGSSAAAAHVAGVAALVKSAKPSLTGSQIRQILISTAVDNMDPGPDINGGYGIVNAEAAVQAAVAP